ncbi:MAG: carboxypeptidase-like regulatory domain-containing protein, partial [Aliidiomarina sp.]|uniref:carboxypeptidase-like regulatory domain-containing protein n=1 Tax=Aliidiomarina sp. TaxID=1872439 RepID=UPI0025BA0072
MRIIFKFLTIFIFLGLTSFSVDANTEEQFELYGTVYLSSHPLANAHIKLQNSDTGHHVSETYTNVDGRYTLPISPGTYRLLVTPPEGLNIEPVVINNIQITDSDLQQNVILLSAAQELSASVLGLNELPIENASISVFTKGRESLITSLTADSQGEFTIALTPGDYLLSIRFRQQSHLGA